MINVVTFPGLGLEFTLDRVAFHPIWTADLLVRHHHRLRDAAGGLPLLQVGPAVRHRTRPHPGPDVFAVPAALVAVRAYYVIFNLDLYRQGDGSLDWGAILRYSDGGLAIYGAIISSVIVLLIFCKVRKVSFLAFADLGVTACSLDNSSAGGAIL